MTAATSPITAASSAGQHPFRSNANRPPRLPAATWWALIAALLTNTVLQRIGLNVSSYPLDLGMLTIAPLAFIALSRGEWRLHVGRVILVATLLAAATISELLNVADASPTSLLLLFVNYLPFVLVSTHSDDEQWSAVGRIFLAFAAVIAVAGVVQYAIQFVWKPNWLFDFTYALPEQLRNNNNYNTTIEAASGMKSNGFFLREPSTMSQLMVLGILVELRQRRRPWLLLLFAAGLIVSYSGTGLLMLGAGILLGMDIATIAFVGGLALLLVALQFIFGDALNLSFTADRVAEFSESGSSAYMRFVAPVGFIANTFFDAPLSALIGHGPGAASSATIAYNAFNPTWTKALYEYGTLGSVAVTTLVASVVFSSRAPRLICIAWFFGWMVVGESLVNTQSNEFTFVVFALWPRALACPQERPARTR